MDVRLSYDNIPTQAEILRRIKWSLGTYPLLIDAPALMEHILAPCAETTERLIIEALEKCHEPKEFRPEKTVRLRRKQHNQRYQCPVCDKYHITMYSSYCAGCGAKVEFHN